jgi:putative transposase
VDRRETFSSTTDRQTYIRLLQETATTRASVCWAGVWWPIMSIWLHCPSARTPWAFSSAAFHGRYAQYYNACAGRSGHLWQNRFFACVLAPDHLWTALAYVERNPVRAGMVGRARDYPWSSAAAHITGQDEHDLLDMEWWHREGYAHWEQHLEQTPRQSDEAWRACTYAGRPFGSETYLQEMAARFDRHWTPGRPKKNPPPRRSSKPDQFSLFWRNAFVKTTLPVQADTFSPRGRHPNVRFSKLNHPAHQCLCLRFADRLATAEQRKTRGQDGVAAPFL